MPSPPLTRLYINGKSTSEDQQSTFDVLNPYTKELVGTCVSASLEDCKAAASSASQAFPAWEAKSLDERRDILLKAADIIMSERYQSSVVKAIEEEVAMPRALNMVQVQGMGGYIRGVACMGNDLRGECFPSSTIPGAQVKVERRAIGVILAIVPWNAPAALTLRGIMIPLLCGNTVVLRPSELSPRSISLIAEALQEGGLPPGVLNVVTMSAQDTPSRIAELIAHPAIRKINFTGSTRVGKIIAMEAAKHLKPCVLELGGKSPAIVLNDADVDQAAKAIVAGAMLFSGQICMSTERVIVQSGVEEAFIAKVKALGQSLKAGDAKEPLGALFSEGSAKNILSMIEDAKSQGAEVIIGDLKRDKAVMQPHILKGVKPGMRLWEDESFGPVFALTVVDTVEEAVEMANLSDYSLSGSLWTSSIDLANEVAPRIRTGFININGSTFHSERYLGLAGLTGSSGYGRFDVEEFTHKRLTITHPPGRKFPFFD
ncbi:aldehyde dehydrogenase domain-containing protein [Mycena floridula]|nr:aldehyde dehydrogenase domain-containing protein [Mycena floridula]